MEQSEKEKLLEEIRMVIQEEVAPVLDILMNYLDVRFDETEQEVTFVCAGIKELLDHLLDVRER